MSSRIRSSQKRVTYNDLKFAVAENGDVIAIWLFACCI
jgi:hypothetical protein